MILFTALEGDAEVGVTRDFTVARAMRHTPAEYGHMTDPSGHCVRTPKVVLRLSGHREGATLCT